MIMWGDNPEKKILYNFETGRAASSSVLSFLLACLKGALGASRRNLREDTCIKYGRLEVDDYYYSLYNRGDGCGHCRD